MTDPIGPNLPFWQRNAAPREQPGDEAVTPALAPEYLQAPPPPAPGYGLEHAAVASEPVYGLGAQPQFFEQQPAFHEPPAFQAVPAFQAAPAFQAPPAVPRPPNEHGAPYSAYPTFSYSVQPRKQGLNVGLMAVVLALLLLAGGGWFVVHRGSAHHASGAPFAVTPSTSLPSAPSPSTQPATSNTTASQLEAKLMTNLPTGYILQPDAVGETGPSDLAKAIKDDGEPGAGSALRADKFVAGYQRLWVDADQGEIVDYVTQFQTPAGAKAYYARQKALLPVEAPSTPKPFTVVGPPGSESMGATAHDAAAGIDTAIAMTQVGKYLVQVVCNGTSSEASPQLATSLIIQQAHLL